MNSTSDWYETFFRGYDPALGRFTAVDPLAFILPDYSPYAYANNNPVLFNDPLGLFASWDEFWNTVGTLYSYEYGGSWNEGAGYHEFGSSEEAMSWGNAYGQMMSAGSDGSIQAIYGYAYSGQSLNASTQTIQYNYNKVITGYKYVSGGGGGGLFWNEFNKSDLLGFAQSQCNCTGGTLEDYAGKIFEETFNTFMAATGDITYRSNTGRFNADTPGRVAVVPDGIATSQVLLNGKLITVPNGSWYEVKATTSTITASSFGKQAAGLVNALAASNPAMAKQGVLYLTFSTTHDASLSNKFALSAKIQAGINVGQYKAMFRVINGTPKITFYSTAISSAFMIKYFSPFRTSVPLANN